MKSSHRMEVIRAILSNKIATNYDKLQIKGKGRCSGAKRNTVGECNVAGGEAKVMRLFG